MNKNEIQELKKELKVEIKNEILAELSASKASTKNGKQFDFDGYKESVVKNDIKICKAFSDKVMSLKYFLPLIGCFFFFRDLIVSMSSIDRGLLRKNISKRDLKYFLLDMLFWATMLFLIFNYFPLKYKRVLRKAIADTEKELEAGLD